MGQQHKFCSTHGLRQEDWKGTENYLLSEILCKKSKFKQISKFIYCVGTSHVRN